MIVEEMSRNVDDTHGAEVEQTDWALIVICFVP